VSGDRPSSCWHVTRLEQVGDLIVGLRVDADSEEASRAELGADVVDTLARYGYTIGVSETDLATAQCVYEWRQMMPAVAPPDEAPIREWLHRIGQEAVLRAMAVTSQRHRTRPPEDAARFWFGICMGIEREAGR